MLHYRATLLGALVILLVSSEADASAWWVFLADRGPDLDARLRARSAELAASPAAARRASVGLSAALPGDLQPWEGYVEAVLARDDCELRVVSRYLNAVSVECPEAVALALPSELPFVDSVRPVASSTFDPRTPLGGTDEPTPLSGFQLSQVGLDVMHERGWTGEGVTMGLLDSGFELPHPVLQETEVLALWDFVDGDPDPSREPGDPPGQADHGTAVLSVVAAVSDRLTGGAPDCSFLLAKTEDISDEYQAEEDYWVAGLEWAEEGGADLVSSSLGYIDWYDYEDMDGATAVTTVAADAAAARGLGVFNSVGNRGPSPGTMNAPADGDSVFSVGAVDGSGAVAAFSSRGPTFDGRTKPDACALGVGCTAARADGSGFYSANGTSFAAPLAASCAATVAQAHPEWDMQTVIGALRATASIAPSPDDDMGWGILDAPSAARYRSVTGSVRNSMTGEPVEGLELLVEVADTTVSTVTNGRGWFAVCPDRLGGYRVESAAGDGLIPASGQLQEEGVELSLYLDPPAASEPPSVFPNPTTGGLWVGFDVASGPVDVSMSVFDLTGQPVYSVEREGVEPGTYRAPLHGEAMYWDGRDGEGELASSGIYVVRLLIGAEARILKASVLR